MIGVTLAEAADVIARASQQLDTPLTGEVVHDPPVPMSIGAWGAVTEWEHDQQTWMSFDGYLTCIISTDGTPSPAGDRAVHLITWPRPDGLFEHIYGPSPHVQSMMRDLAIRNLKQD